MNLVTDQHPGRPPQVTSNARSKRAAAYRTPILNPAHLHRTARFTRVLRKSRSPPESNSSRFRPALRICRCCEITTGTTVALVARKSGRLRLAQDDLLQNTVVNRAPPARWNGAGNIGIRGQAANRTIAERVVTSLLLGRSAQRSPASKPKISDGEIASNGRPLSPVNIRSAAVRETGTLAAVLAAFLSGPQVGT